MIAARFVRKAWSGWRMVLAATRMFAPLVLLASDSSVMIVAAVFARPKQLSFLSPRFFCCKVLILSICLILRTHAKDLDNWVH